ncbi:hypothetical protein P3T27_008084 [Kitasatospora sp. MAA19]|uniref:hypothetical protein n=1 Tax=unclassified Kitasatospora TaxID=2633591 RepID=UPI002472F358|nr:hypothetical protein [Kitasatospora sp. MAA19]MDH6711326.1 hypothetical protein [Kitasatospora sp. MAA19]
MTTLADILTGTPLTSPAGETVSLATVAAAHLLAAIDTDRSAMSLFGSPKADQWELAVEEVIQDRGGHQTAVTVTAYGLRYLIDHQATASPELHRLCTVTGCEGDAMSYQAQLTVVCTDHLDVPSEIALSHGWDSPRAARLEEWTRIAADDERIALGDLNTIDSLRLPIAS